MSSSEENASFNIFASLKHPVRRKIITLLSNGPKSYSDLLKEFGIESSHLNYHLDGLRDLLVKAKDGKYALSNLGQTALTMMNEVEGKHYSSDLTKSYAPPEKHRNRKFLFGKHSIPMSIIAALLILMISGSVLSYYLYSSFTVPTQIKEPIQIVNYPSQWGLYPGETLDFNVTINNHASMNYTVVLDFSSNDSAYQSQYLTFCDDNYTVVPGQQNLASWLNVSTDAPADNLAITVTVARSTNANVASTGNLITNGDFETGDFNGWVVTGVCSISNTVVHGGTYSAYISDEIFDSYITQNFDPGKVLLTDGLTLDAWINPDNVGGFAGQNHCSGIDFMFYNPKTASMLEPILYDWCWASDNPHINRTLAQDPEGGRVLFTPSGWTIGAWNELLRNVTADVYSFYNATDLTGVYLSSITIRYHYSNGSPGAFYVDDVKLTS
jgi:DNA-binding transcriptional ArsR family regulator